MISEQNTENIARLAFAEIAARFPQLSMIENTDALVEISITIPSQSGSKQKVWLALQNKDELHFSAGHFWLEWFPCTDAARVKDYIDAVTGFLSGNYRILEHYRGSKCVKAELQKPNNTGWHTIGTWSLFYLPFPWGKTINEVRNA